MQQLQWNPAWEMGDASLDIQHRAMLAASNRLAEALAEGRPQAEIKRAISFLLVYVDAHFRNEERLMERKGYPELAEHRAQHAACARKVDRLLDLCRTGSADTLPDLTGFFQDWLVDHFEGSDREFAAFLTESPAG